MAGGMHGGAGGHAWQGGVWHGVRMAGGHAWWGMCMAGGMHGRGHAWQGAMHGGGHVWLGGHVWQERWPLQREVRILLECILVKKLQIQL